MDKVKTTLILVLLLVAAILTQGFTKNPFGGGNTAEAEETAKDFIAENLMQGAEDGFEIKEVVEENGLYKLTVDVQGRDITSYMTKDQTVFFPSAMEMTPGEESDQTAQEQEEIPQSDKPKISLFTMSFCPYGSQAEEMISPVVDLLGDAIETELRYIFYENYQGGGPEYCLDEESTYCAMHGIPEAEQNIRELCVYNNQEDKFWDYIDQVNEDCTADDIDTCWKQAAQTVGVNTASVESCFEENKLAYAEEEFNTTEELNISGSPTLLINGATFSGDRTVEGYKKAICGAFKEAPEECEEVLGDEEAEPVEGGC